MNMTAHLFSAMAFSAMDFIVLAALLFAIVLVIAWALSPNLRRWIERPKYRFLDEVESYDRADVEGYDHAQKGGHRRA